MKPPKCRGYHGDVQDPQQATNTTSEQALLARFSMWDGDRQGRRPVTACDPLQTFASDPQSGPSRPKGDGIQRTGCATRSYLRTLGNASI